MSGHSKWSTIKRQKGVADARRSAVFTKHARLIAVATREGGKDPEHNFRLRLAMDRARAVNMPNDNIDRAIKSGAGELKGSQVKELVYEGFGPGGVAIIARAVSDNPNRTAADLRSVFQKHGGTLGGQNSVAWMFQLRGVIRLSAEALPADQQEKFELAAVDAGATDLRIEEGSVMIETTSEGLHQVQQWVAQQGVTIAEAGLEYVPTTTVEVSPTDREKVFSLLSALDDHDDVTEVYSNDR